LPHLDIILPYIADPPEFETLIDARTTTLIHQLTSSNTPNGGVRGQIAVQFFDRKRRKSGWLTGIGRANEEEVLWEEWLVEVTIARPKTEGGGNLDLFLRLRVNAANKRISTEREKVRRAMESSLQKTAMKIVGIVNRDKDHIPPITTSDANPFPYKIVLNPKQEGYGHRFGGWN
jgi:autophagy-related protein 101